MFFCLHTSQKNVKKDTHTHTQKDNYVKKKFFKNRSTSRSKWMTGYFIPMMVTNKTLKLWKEDRKHP